MSVDYCPRSFRRRGDELSPFKIALGFVRQFRSLLCTSPIGVCGEFRMMGIEVVLKSTCVSLNVQRILYRNVGQIGHIGHIKTHTT